MSIHSDVPESAEEKLLRTDEHGHSHYDCVADGKVIATRVRYPDGSLDEEKLMQDGLPHGHYRQFSQHGILLSGIFSIPFRRQQASTSLWNGESIPTFR